MLIAIFLITLRYVYFNFLEISNGDLADPMTRAHLLPICCRSPMPCGKSIIDMSMCTILMFVLTATITMGEVAAKARITC